MFTMCKIRKCVAQSISITLLQLTDCIFGQNTQLYRKDPSTRYLAPFKTVYVDSTIKCCAACGMEATCKAVSYQNISDTCDLNDRNPTYGGSTSMAGWMSFHTTLDVVKELTVTNGGPWGNWAEAQFCAQGAYAVGYSMQIEAYQQSGDDTTLNSIALHCETLATGTIDGEITSGTGQWGDWNQQTLCASDGDSSATNRFLKAFSLQVEPRQEQGDDTAANFIKFKCRDMQDDTPNHELSAHPGSGGFGTFGGWSESCDRGSAICGLKTRIEGYIYDGDDTALNDVVFYCCSD